ncbi:MAG: hypothetical protein ACREBQ_12835, partial [Nitrososphaerales archaeon]
MSDLHSGDPHCHAGFAVVMLAMIALVTQLGKGAPLQRSQASDPWRLATEDTEIVLSTQGGWPVLKALTSTAAGYDWLSSPVRESLMKTVTFNGVPTKTHWRFEGADRDTQGNELTFRYSNSNPTLELRSVWRARPGHGPVEHWIT